MVVAQVGCVTVAVGVLGALGTALTVTAAPDVEQVLTVVERTLKV